MKKKLEKLVPPGYETENICIFWCIGITVCVMIALGVILDVERNLNFLQKVSNFTEYFSDDRVSFAFRRSVRHRCFTVLAVGTFIYVPMHYAYYHRESKSIYTMRRLGRPLERHIRAWALPVLLSVATLAMRAIVIVLLFCYYLSRTQGVATAPGQWEEVWRLIIYDRIN